MSTIIMRASDDDRTWSFSGFIPRFSDFGKPADQPRFPRGTYRRPKIIRERSTVLPALSVFADRHEKEQSALWFHDVQHGRCPKAFAQQHVSASGNRHAGHEAFNVSVAQNHLLDVTVRGWCPACRFDERNREDHGRFGGDIPLFDFD
ncbi:hypothetical protein [Bifidobacterium bifidum]|jgi:hypothetical protein|uniref:hypothetical protein n=1 Tax=Bifidobacterium bifidum TaxID=1681 RepID=UPI0022E165A3|nr:hypothetical protein [Bifidobacterium bifidum]